MGRKKVDPVKKNEAMYKLLEGKLKQIEISREIGLSESYMLTLKKEALCKGLLLSTDQKRASKKGEEWIKRYLSKKRKGAVILEKWMDSVDKELIEIVEKKTAKECYEEMNEMLNKMLKKAKEEGIREEREKWESLIKTKNIIII